MVVATKGALVLGDSAGAAGTVTAPTNGAAIITIAAGSLPAGEYEVRARGMYGGTADVINGMELREGATPVMTLSVPAVANGEPPPTCLPRVTLDGATALSVNARQAGAVGSVYRAEIVATRTGA